MSMRERCQARKDEQIDEEVQLQEKPRPPRLRYRYYRHLAPIKIRHICRSCHAPCCALSCVHTAISRSESPFIYRQRSTRPWILQIYYPKAAVYQKSLRDSTKPRPRFVQVRGMRMRSGRPDYGCIEVHLAKKKDGTCVHLRCDGHCSIYARRPHACKTWFCGRGTDSDYVWRKLCEEESLLWTPKREE